MSGAGNPGVMNWIAALELDVAFLIVILPVMLIAAFGALVTRLIFGRMIGADSTVGAAKSGTAAEIYAVVLGFIVVFGFSQFQETRTHVLQEATLLARLIEDPPGDARQTADIVLAAKAYAADVVRYDWPLMARGGASAEASASARALGAKLVETADPAAPIEAFHRLQMVEEISAHRVSRLSATPDPQVASLIFQVLAIGTAVSVITGWFLRGPSILVHMLLSAVISGSAVALLILSAQLLYPFSGAVSISSEPFQAILETREI